MSNSRQLFRDIFKNAYLPYRDPETLKGFLKIIDEFTYDHSERLGDAFEYLLSVLGSQGSAGQFRTPRHIIDFMAEVIDPKKDDTILDPACGTAGFLISSYKHILKHNSSNFDVNEDKQVIDEKIKSLNELTLNSKKYKGDKLTPDERSGLAENIKGYDISPDMVRLSLVNMYLHGLNDPDIAEYDTLTSEDNWNKYADVILANPPFMSPKGGIRPHNRFTVKSNRSEVLFVDYIAEHLTPNGRAAVIVPEGIIFQSGKAYKQLRKLLVEEYLVGVISLPAGVFNPYSGVKTSILWLDKSLAKKSDKILFIKIENDGFDLGAQRRPIKHNDLPEALQTIKAYKNSLTKSAPLNLGELSEGLRGHVVEKTKIADNGDYNLSGDRYHINLDVNSQYPKSILENLCEFNNGLWKGKKEPFVICNVIRNTNFRKDGFIDWTDIASLEVERKQFEKRELEYGDIIIEKSGGGPTQPVGRVVLFNKNEKGYSYSNFTSRIRVINQSIKPEFLWLILRDFYYRGETERLQKRTSGIRNLDFNLYKQIQIPLPPLSVQEEIVAEIEGYQKIINGACQVVENYTPQIKINPEWEMVELGEVCGFKRGPFGGSLKKEIFIDSGYCVYEQSHAIKDNFSNVRYFITDEKFNEMKGFEVRPGDLIMSCSGTMGKIAIAPENLSPGIINQALLKLSVKERLHRYYLKQIVESDYFQKALANNTYGAAIKNVASVKVLKQIKIPLPDIEIQEKIVNEITKERSLIENNIQIIELYEQKIKDKIAEVLGEDKKEAKKDPKPYEINESEQLMAAES